tara:strand:+ start:1 stop:1152 length:1152 start_codon:yes stop_codon:yes gene_type:complete
MNFEKLNTRVGIIGGGQLGKMLLTECNKMNIKTSVLDSSENSPCKNLTDKFVCGDFNDFTSVYNFGKDCDVITFEIEHINVDALERLENEGKRVFHKSKTLRIIQDKNLQKSFFRDNKIPTSEFKYYNSIDELKESINNNEIEFPCIWKKTKFGYDGFGVKILNSINDLSGLPESEMIIEEMVSFEKELSVIVTRNVSGEVSCFNTVEMEFNKRSNQVEFVISPANVSNSINIRAKELAIKLSKSLDCVGVLAVEMFLVNGEILVNEIAPRPHNSGHFSIEACSCSQYQQHIRAILDLDLGESNHTGSAVMLNLVGGKNFYGKVFYENLDLVFKTNSANLHIYGKEETRPNRKMGHVTIICNKFEDAYEKAKFLKDNIKIKSK